MPSEQPDDGLQFVSASQSTSLITTIHVRRTVRYYAVQEGELALLTGFNNQCAWFGSFGFGLLAFAVGVVVDFQINGATLADGKADPKAVTMLTITTIACLILAVLSFAMAGFAWRGRNSAIADLKRQSESA